MLQLISELGTVRRQQDGLMVVHVWKCHQGRCWCGVCAAGPRTLPGPHTDKKQLPAPTCVAMPTGQVLVWHLRIMMQPSVMRGAVAKPNSSAPSSAATVMSRPVRIWPSACSTTHRTQNNTTRNTTRNTTQHSQNKYRYKAWRSDRVRWGCQPSEKSVHNLGCNRRTENPHSTVSHS